MAVQCEQRKKIRSWVEESIHKRTEIIDFSASLQTVMDFLLLLTGFIYMKFETKWLASCFDVSVI